MIGIIELGPRDQITIYALGGRGTADVHRFEGKGLREIHAILGCSAYLLDKQDFHRIAPRQFLGGSMRIEAVAGLNKHLADGNGVPVAVISAHVSAACKGERCHCGQPAVRKVEETVFHDDPLPARHPLTSYVCARHFRDLMGPAADA